MAIVLKYQPMVGAGDLGRLLLSLSQGLGRLRDMLADATCTRFVAVTRAEALSVAETSRLLVRLQRLGVHVPAVIVNALGAGTCANCANSRSAQDRALHALRLRLRSSRRTAAVYAPAIMPPPFGVPALTEWRATWRGTAS